MDGSVIHMDSVADLQRKLGRCLLRLQQYERLLKAMVAHSELAGPPEQLQALRDEKVACAHKKTMGTLMGMLTEGYLTPPRPESEEASADSGDRFWISFRFQMEMSSEQYEETKAALKELVDLRNELVHHFLQRFDLWESSGCEAADRYLDESYETIDGHYLILHGWAKAMDEARTTMASFMETQAFKDAFLNGIWVDGSIDWPGSGITACLREAETRLAQNGWTALDAAIAWVARTYPEQTPKRYGCGSWRHVIHESKQFEIRKQIQPENGRTVVWYRRHP